MPPATYIRDPTDGEIDVDAHADDTAPVFDPPTSMGALVSTPLAVLAHATALPAALPVTVMVSEVVSPVVRTDQKNCAAFGCVPETLARVSAVHVFDFESAMVNVWLAFDSTMVTQMNAPAGTALVTGMT